MYLWNHPFSNIPPKKLRVKTNHVCWQTTTNFKYNSSKCVKDSLLHSFQNVINKNKNNFTFANLTKCVNNQTNCRIALEILKKLIYLAVSESIYAYVYTFIYLD